ncbi:MAG: heme ABC exporter ATP-binding protein CcmA [Rhizobiaceae bacterium]|nr:heme ABC exporter ATP-binding protein CcmA [Rhizobiaceae bacterium]
MRLVAENLGGERGGRTVFSGIDFAVQEGEATVITGPNGAGKSTLLRVVAGLLPATSGQVRFENGGEAFPTPAAAAHFLAHLNAMKPVLTVAENLSFWAQFQGADNDVETALARVGLQAVAHLPFGYLSTGQRRRASVARMLVSSRPLWLLDEPTTGMDADSVGQFSILMKEHLAGGGMILAATHLPLGLGDAAELRMTASTMDAAEVSA